MIQRHHQYVSDDLITSSLTECVKQQQLNSRTCSDFDLHNLSYTISPSVDYHSFSSFYSPKSFNTPAYSYVSEDFLHSLNSSNLKASSLSYSPVIDRSNDRNYLSKLTKRKQLFVNKSEMQCNSSSKMISPTSKHSKSTYFDPESLVSYTLQSNVKKSSKSTPCLNQQASHDQIDSASKTPKSKRKSAINWPFKRSNSNSAAKPTVPFSIQQHTSKTVSMLHKKLLSKSQSNLKNADSTKSPLSIMSNVTLKRSSNNKKQTIKLFGQSISKLCLGDRHLIAPVKNMLIELMQRAPQTVGIFRKSANARVCRELKAELEQNPDCDLSEYPIIVIASVFKELLRSLPDCVLVGKMYQKWLQAAKLIDDSSVSHSDCFQFIRPLIKSLPKANYLLLQHFLCILHYIAEQSAENKMSAENLAVCIGPSLLNHDIAPSSMHCELSKQVPKLISYLIKNCSDLFGANTLTLFEAYQNMVNENKENEMKEIKDSGAEESDSLNELNNNLTNCKTSNDLNIQKIKSSHPHFQPSQSPISSVNTFSSFASSNNNSANSTPKIYEESTNENTNVNSSPSISSTKVHNNGTNGHRLLPPSNNVHQSYYGQILSQPYAVNKVSLSNLSRDSGLTLSDTQLYSPEEDDIEDDYHHIIHQHLHLSKKLNGILSDKCLSNKTQFKINSTNKITNNSTSLKKKCNSKLNRLNATSSEEDDLHDELEDVDIDELSEKSCSSENCTPLYSRVYNKHNDSDHHLLTKSAPQLANIDTIGQSKKIIDDKKTTNVPKITCTTIPLYLHSIKNNSISTDSATNSSCNSPSSASNVSSTSLNLSSSNEYSASELQRKYFNNRTPSEHLASTPITTNSPHIVTISAKGNSLQVSTPSQATICNVSMDKDALNMSTTSQKSINPPSYQETMNRKEINARIANLMQSNTSRKISDSEIDNLISKKIYEQSLRVYNADINKELTLRAVPAHVKSQSSSDSDSDSDQYPKRKITNTNSTIKLANIPVDQFDGRNYSTTQVRSKPIIQQRCAKDETEYWKKNVNWSVATLRNKFTELCKQNECSTLNRSQRTESKENSCKSISSIYDLCKNTDLKTGQKLIANKPPINKLRLSCLSQSSQLLDNNHNNKNCVTIIQVNQTRSTDSLSGEESYV